jgi:hypothetical protein
MDVRWMFVWHIQGGVVLGNISRRWVHLPASSRSRGRLEKIRYRALRKGRTPSRRRSSVCWVLAVNLGLSAFDLRHTSSVLRDYGNLSSGSFLFSYLRLQSEGAPVRGDYGIMMTMGPGSSIETALIRWQ